MFPYKNSFLLYFFGLLILLSKSVKAKDFSPLGTMRISSCNVFDINIDSSFFEDCKNNVVKNSKSILSKNSSSLIIAEKPKSKFKINNSAQCLKGNSFVFTDSSTTPSGTLQYTWSFGDGSTSVLQNPTHVYTSAGTYNVRLIVKISNAVGADTSILPIIVYPNTNSSFSVNDTFQCFKKNTFLFSHNVTPSSGVSLTYSWDFGDNKTGSSSNPVHSYSASGAYKVKLNIVSQFGCKDSSKLDVLVYGDVTSKFVVNDSSQCLTGNQFTFTNLSTYNDNVLISKWFFGDDSSSIEFNPVHTYKKEGTYSCKLVSGNSANCFDTSILNLIVFPLPKSSFKINKSEQQLTNNNFLFTNLTITESGQYNSKWDFGDFSSSDLNSPEHSYIDIGTYTITLITTSDVGCTDTLSKSVIVTTAVTAKFTVTETISCIDKNLFLFTNESIVNGGKIKYLWDFGDSTTTIESDPFHTYKQPGTYKVKLLTTGSFGGIDSVSITLIVAPLPKAGFKINDSIQCLPNNNFSFFNTSSVEFGKLIYDWNMGDSSKFSVRNLKYSYNKTGVFDIKLIVFSEFGCKDSTEQKVKVIFLPNGITYDSIVTRENFDTKLTARNADSASYLWSPSFYLNDNTLKDPIFNGNNPTKFTIKITDQYKCTFIDTLSVYFFKNVNIVVPKAFTPNKDNLNDNLKPILLGIKELKYFKIFNRWGVLLYTSNDPKIGWDGTYKGTLQPMDTYTWVASGIDIDGKTVSKSGNFLLVK